MKPIKNSTSAVLMFTSALFCFDCLSIFIVRLRQFDELIKIPHEAKEHKEQIHPFLNKVMYKTFTHQSKQFPFIVIPPKKASSTELARESM